MFDVRELVILPPEWEKLAAAKRLNENFLAALRVLRPEGDDARRLLAAMMQKKD